MFNRSSVYKENISSHLAFAKKILLLLISEDCYTLKTIFLKFINFDKLSKFATFFKLWLNKNNNNAKFVTSDVHCLTV